MKCARADRDSGFTLTEILVVVAIVAIIMVIAVPNFLTARMRSKVAHTKSDFAELGRALDTYFVDFSDYPGGNSDGMSGARPGVPGDPTVLERLSTPIGYVTSSLLPQPFTARRFSGPALIGLGAVDSNIDAWPQTDMSSPNAPLYSRPYYTAFVYSDEKPSGFDRARIDVAEAERVRANGYVLQSPGPLEALINLGGIVANADAEYSVQLFYDPTNGTVSFGNIFRGGGVTITPGDNFTGVALTVGAAE